MMYYRIAIIGDYEYSAADPLWSCVYELRRRGHAVLALSPKKYKAVSLDAEPSHEEGMGAFRSRFAPHIVLRYEEGMTADSILAAASLSQNEPMAVRAKHFVIFGFVGKDNFGDELIFSILCDRIGEKYPEAYFSLIGHGPMSSFVRQGVTSITSLDKHEMDFMLNGASALIFMAGIVFDDPFVNHTAGKIDLFLNPSSTISGQVAATMIAKMHDVPVFGLGIGAGPLANPDAHRLLQLASLCDPIYFTRDVKTTELLLAAGIKSSSVRQKADMAFTFAFREDVSVLKNVDALSGKAGEFFIVSLREWHNATDDFFSSVALMISHISKKYRLTPVFVDFSPIDAELHRRVAAELDSSVEPVFYGVADDFQEVFLLFKRSRFSLAMRLHASIISTFMHHPCLAFDYNDKVGALFDDACVTENLMQMDYSANQMLEVADRFMANYESYAEKVAEYATQSKIKAFESYAEMFEIVDSRNPIMDEVIDYSRTVSAAELKLAATKRKLKKAEKEITVLRQQLDGVRKENERMKSTYSWKIGNLVVKPFRMLRNLLKG